MTSKFSNATLVFVTRPYHKSHIIWAISYGRYDLVNSKSNQNHALDLALISEFRFRMIFIIVPAAGMAALVHHDFTVMELFWTFSVYLEAVAIMPQLQMIAETGEAETITTHYLFMLGCYRYIQGYLLWWNVYIYIQSTLSYQLDLPISYRELLWQNRHCRRLCSNRSLSWFLLLIRNQRYVLRNAHANFIRKPSELTLTFFIQLSEEND